MAMKSSEYWKKREAENAMKNQISEVQYKKDIEYTGVRGQKSSIAPEECFGIYPESG